jgi:pSer/pThr/pTyr-binding forkhead associated (FHA) protein
VTAEDERTVVEDLGSKNGTFVNGERVEEPRPLRPGDRIDVGGITVTFCRVESVSFEGMRSDDATVMLDSPPAARADEAFRGNLAEVPAAAVLQLLSEGGKTGVLSIVGSADSARLWFAEGRPVHAECAGLEGVEAAIRICGLAEGRFLFAPGRPPPAVTVDLPVTALLLEASRLADEHARV